MAQQPGGELASTDPTTERKMQGFLCLIKARILLETMAYLVGCEPFCDASPAPKN
jgi:hypothetical protein